MFALQFFGDHRNVIAISYAFRIQQLCLKITKMSRLDFSVLAFYTNFCVSKIDLSGNTRQLDHFWHSMNYSNETFFVIFKHCVRIQTNSIETHTRFVNIVPIEKTTSLVVDASLMLLRGCKCVPFFNCNYFGTTLQNSNTKEMRKYRSS